VPAREVPIATLLGNHAAVIALRLRVVVAGSRARLGELLQAQFFHQRGRLAVCVLGVVVRVEAQFDKGEGRQQPLQGPQRLAPGNALPARELALGDLVDAVDVIDPLDLVGVALVHRVQPGPVR